MDDAVFRWTGPPFILLAGTMLLLAWWRWRHRRPAALCPGPRRHAIRRLSPLRWCWRRGCRYDLTGLVPDETGLLRCPECGRRLERRRAIATRYRWQAGPCGLLAFAIGCGLWLVPALRKDRWTAMIPTMALVVTEGVSDDPMPRRLERELDRRVWNGTVTGWPARRLAEAAARDLHDDEIRGNARRAMQILGRLGGDAIPALEEAIESDDWQQRQIAASVLRRAPGATPSETLIRVTVEGLRDDDLPTERDPGGWAIYTPVLNAEEGFHYLLNVPVTIEPFLADAMRGGDTQQRFICALIACHRDRETLMDQAVPILIEHLADNDTWSDARKSREALLLLGPRVLPMLEPYVDADDRQQRRYVRDLVHRLGGRE